jgi:hypothetical protein
MTAHKAFASGAVVIDDRYLPALITTFFGEVSLEAATWHGAQHQALVEAEGRRGHRVVTITDSSHTRPPPAEVRKYWGEMTKRLPPAVKEATLVAFVVIKSPVIRGVMTALGWLNPELRSVEVYDTMETALDAARQRLKAANQEPPPAVGPYELPPECQTTVAKWLA